MAVGFRLTSILLVCMLSELDHSSAFPRTRSSVYPETWQGLSEKPQGGYNFGNRRPLQYVQALRQAHRKLQPSIHDQVEVKTWQKPQGSSLSHAQIQNHPGVYRQTQSRIHTSLPQPPALENHLLPKPRNFEFSLKVPFASSLGQNKETETKETSLGTKSSDSNSGGSDGAGQYSQSYRPSSVQIHSNFSSPSGLDAFLDKVSTNDRNGEKNAREVTKPSFQLSLSVPIPTTTQSSKPSSSNDGYSENLKRPGTAGFVQNSYTEPPKPLFSSTQTGSGWTLLNSGKTVQQQTEQQIYDPVRKPITFSPGHASQHVAPTEQISQGKIPNKQSQVFSKLLTKYPAPSLPIPHYPQQSDNVYSGYYSAQTNPTSNDYEKGQSGQTVLPNSTNVHLSLSPSQYERVPSGHYSAGLVQPNNYGQRQPWQPDGPQLTSASEQDNYSQFKPSYGQNVDTVYWTHSSPVHSSSPAIDPSQQELPSFDYNREVATTTNYHATSDVVQMGQTDVSLSYQYSKGQSGQDVLPHHLTAVDSSPHFQDLSTEYQTQMRLPGQDTGPGQVYGKPHYTKLFIDVEDETDGGLGQNSYFTTPTTHYDGDSRQNVAETLNNPSPLFAKARSLVSASQDQLPGLLGSTSETYPRNKPDTYKPISHQANSMDREIHQYASNPQQQMRIKQLQASDPVPGQTGPAGQIQLMQPTSGQSTENSYTQSANRINQSNTYGLNYLSKLLWQ